MARYTKQVSVSGAWVKASELTNGSKARLVSETVSQPSTFLDKQGLPKTQDVAKLRIEGQADPMNCSLNRATINALVDAFGEDSKDWMNKTLIVETEKVRVAGKSVTALYLIPDGYEKTDDANGYAVIEKMTTKPKAKAKATPTDEDPIQVDEPPTPDDSDLPW